MGVLVIKYGMASIASRFIYDDRSSSRPGIPRFIISTVWINLGRSKCFSNDVGAFRSATFCLDFPLLLQLILTVVGAVAVIVAAQSITCAISVAICFMAALVLRLSDRISAAGLATKACVILVVSLLTIAVVDIGALTSIVVAWQQEKTPSITAHLSDFERLVDAHPLSFLGIAPTGVMGECGWLNLLT